MSRKTTSILWVCLLLLLPVSVVAQTLEYWFDDDFDNRSSVSIAVGSEQELDLNLQSNTLFPPGFHKLNMRAIVGGKPTAITSSGVLKIAAGDISLLEYWVDDDRDNVRTIGGKEANTGGSWQFLSDFDFSDIPVGFHYLNCRAVSNSRRTATAVTSTGFFKMPSGVVTHLQYWIDDDITNAKTIEGKEANTGGSWQFLSNLDLSAVSPGFHKLNCRAVSTNNQLMSSVSSTGFYKNALGNITHIEYWLDNDRKNIQTVAVNSSEDGSTFGYIKDFNLTTASPGHHKVHFRAVSADRKTTSAVTTTAVNVKPRKVPTGDEVVISKYNVSIDGVEGSWKTVPNPGRFMNLIYPLDARNLSEGSHKVKFRFFNSANAGVSSESAFNVTVPAKPALKLTAKTSEGVVSLSVNSVPDDVAYKFMRVNNSGAKTKVDGLPKSQYPTAVSLSDNPPAGKYVYYVECKYKDWEGNIQEIKSNEVSVTINEAQPETAKYGNLIGQIRFKDRYDYYFDQYVIRFSDGQIVRSDKYGRFVRKNVPFGSSFTVTINDVDRYNFSVENVTMTKEEQHVTITGEDNEEYLAIQTEHDLQFNSFVEIDPGKSYKFTVKNVSGSQWHGFVRVKAIRKEYVDHPASIQPGSVMAGSVASFTEKQNYDIAYSDNFYIEKDKTKDLELKHLSFNWPANPEYYYFYFETVSNNITKMIALNPEECNLKNNPHLWLMDVAEGTQSIDDINEKYLDHLTNLILTMCASYKEFDEQLGDFSSYLDELREILGANLEIPDYTHLALQIEHAKSYDDLYWNAPLWRMEEITYAEAGRFSKLSKKIREEIASSVKVASDFLKYAKQAKEILDNLKEAELNPNDDPFDRFFNYADIVLNLAKDYPFVSLIKTYFDVGKIAVANVKALGRGYHSSFKPEYLSGENALFDSERDNRNKKHNLYINFRIHVDKKGWGVFDGKDIFSQVLSMEITAVNSNGNKKAKITGNLKADGDYLYLEQTGIEGSSDGGSYLDGGHPLEELWMEIKWANGRKTRVSLLESDEVKCKSVTEELLLPGPPITYTVKFYSETRKVENMADIIYLIDKYDK